MKTLILILSLLNILPVFARDYVAGKDYFILDKKFENAPDVANFFSFYCPHCFYYEMKSNINEHIQSSLPKGTSFVQFHSSHIGPLGNELTRAWALSIYLKNEKIMRQKIFTAIQLNHSINTELDLQTLFVTSELSLPKIKELWHSKHVEDIYAKQSSLSTKLDVKFVPSFYVHGKYLINNSALDVTTNESFEKDFSDIIIYLLNKKDSPD